MSTTVSTGWLGRLAESIKGVLIGLVLVLASIVVLFWNEGRAVKTARSLEEGSKVVVSIKPDAVDPANEGKLVHVSGDLQTSERVTDPVFGVAADALVVRRTVEMYQRTLKSETKKKLGGGEETTYSCDDKEWSASRIDVSKCKDVPANPELRWDATEVYAKDAHLGSFHVPPELLRQLGEGEPLAVDADALKSASEAVAHAAVVHDGKVYVGADPGKPAIGDLRVSFQVVKPVTVSAIAAQRESGLAPYPTKAGDPLFQLTRGARTAAEMFKAAQAANVTTTWILRFLGWLFMGIGFFLVFRPLVVMADVIPVLGTLLGSGIFLFSLLLGSMVSTFTCAIAWLFYRPLIGAALIGAGVACVAVLAIVGRTRRRR